jgi:hypothetical protein
LSAVVLAERRPDAGPRRTCSNAGEAVRSLIFCGEDRRLEQKKRRRKSWLK